MLSKFRQSMQNELSKLFLFCMNAMRRMPACSIKSKNHMRSYSSTALRYHTIPTKLLVPRNSCLPTSSPTYSLALILGQAFEDRSWPCRILLGLGVVSHGNMDLQATCVSTLVVDVWLGVCQSLTLGSYPWALPVPHPWLKFQGE